MGAALHRIQLGNALSAFGNGFTVPYLYVYVGEGARPGREYGRCRLAMLAVAALVVLPLTGRAIDRRGAAAGGRRGCRHRRRRVARSGPVHHRAPGHRLGDRARRRYRGDPAGPGDDDRVVLDDGHPLACFRHPVLPEQPRSGHRRPDRRPAGGRDGARQLCAAVRDRGRDVPGPGRGGGHRTAAAVAAGGGPGAERGTGQGRLARAVRRPPDDVAVPAGLRAVLRLLRTVQVGPRGVRHRGHADLTVHASASRWPPTPRPSWRPSSSC
ncbi:hypothetical protein SRIMM317S_04824 [Streptomyces rimosus subsp. rimosus]